MRASYLFSIFLLGVLSPSFASAAELYFEAYTKEAIVNQYVEVGVFLDTEGEFINAIEGTISFPSSILALKEIRTENSSISFWVEQPFDFAQGELRFAGVIFGGYTGSGGHLFSVIFQAQNEGNAVLGVSNARTLLNDGTGSETSFHSSPIVFTI